MPIDFNRCDYVENIGKYCDPKHIFYPTNEYNILKVSSNKKISKFKKKKSIFAH